MTSWMVFVLVGIGTYAFRIVPLLAGTAMAPRVERAVHHAGTAAVTALVVGAIRHVDGGGPPSIATVAAVAVGLVGALRGWTMLRIVVAGAATFVAVGRLVDQVLSDQHPIGSIVAGSIVRGWWG